MTRLLVFGLAVVLAACGSSSVSEPSSEVTLPPSTTSTAAPSTTTIPEPTTTTLSPSQWGVTVFVPVVDEFNAQFGLPFQDHTKDLEFSEAQLDCVEVLPLVDVWLENLKPAPDPTLDALVDAAFERLTEGVDRCIGAETLGDWREVGIIFDSFLDAMYRIDDKTYP